MNNTLNYALLMATSIAGVTLVHLSQATPARQVHACLAIGHDVCFSGTTEWVAKAAESLPRQPRIMIAMAGQAI